MAAWAACFGVVILWRAGSFQSDGTARLVVLGLWPLAAILLTLFIVGGYDRRTDMLSLTYMSEHLIGMGAALVAASVLVYCFASYDFPVKPGRGTLLLGFPGVHAGLARLPPCHRDAAARGHGAQAFPRARDRRTVQTFFATYKRSSNRQTLRFIDIEQIDARRHAS